MTVERIPIDANYDWLAARREFIGASEVATVCGVASYGSLAELYAEKKGLRPPLIDSGVLRRGRWGEASVFQALADERPEWQVARARLHLIDRGARLACTPDGFAVAPDRDGYGVIQAKVVSRSVFRQRWLDDPDEFDGSATPPAGFRLQVMTERMLSDVSWSVLAVLINGEWDWQLRLFEIERDDSLEDHIRKCVASFVRNHLDPGVMPDFQPLRDQQLIRHLYPRDDGTEIDLSADARALVAVEELTEAQAALGRLKKTEAALKTELCGKLGEHTLGRLADGRRLSWKQQSRKTHVVEASTFRVFRVLPGGQ